MAHLVGPPLSGLQNSSYHMNHMKQLVKIKEASYKGLGPAENSIVRVTYTIPRDDVETIEVLRRRFSTGADEMLNKSEVVRAGLLALQGMTEAKLRQLVKRLERYKPGRPKTPSED